MKIVLSRLAPALALVVLIVGVGSAAGVPPKVGSSQYVVRGDPRLCPSPLCGGSWATLANHARTRCHDGAIRPRCYVASTVDEERHPTAALVPEGGLARARIESWRFDGVGELGVLVVADVRAPAGGSTGRVFRLRDNRRRCVRAPCFWISASLVNTSTRTTLSAIDLSHARLTGEQQTSEVGAGIAHGVVRGGRVVPVRGGGRVLRVSGIFLGTA